MLTVAHVGGEISQCSVAPCQVPVQQEQGRQALLAIEWREGLRPVGCDAAVHEIEIQRQAGIARCFQQRARQGIEKLAAYFVLAAAALCVIALYQGYLDRGIPAEHFPKRQLATAGLRVVFHG